MKFLFILVVCSTYTSAIAQDVYSDSLNKVRKEHEHHFLNEVLNAQERSEHPEICFFKPDTTFRVRAVFKKSIGAIFDMPKTNNKTAPYRKYGTLTFTIRDTVCVLNVYQSMDLKGKKEYKNYFFIPFKDGTTSISSYGAGRYLDCYISKKQTWVILDFNVAYHPYCAYSYRYSCPIVPAENYLNVSIAAGECYYEHE